MTKQPGLIPLLNDASSPYRDPLSRLNWDGLDLERWWLPPHALSLTGVEEFERLAPAVRRRLSHCEYVYLLEAGLWLKSRCVRRISRALEGASAALHSRYLHEIREKAGHGLMFLELMERTGVRIPEAHRYRPRLPLFCSDDSALCWALTLIGEELSDKLNRAVRQMSDSVPVCAVVYHLTTLHAMDQTRHIALARARFEEASGRLSSWQRLLQTPLLSWFLRALTRYVFLPPAAVYEAAGLGEPCVWRARATVNPVRKRLIDHAVKPTLDFLRDQGWCVRGLNG
jgi:hypothetical protein